MRENNFFKRLKEKRELEDALNAAIISVGENLKRESRELKAMRERNEIVDDQVEVVKSLQEAFTALIAQKNELKEWTVKEIDVTKVLCTLIVCVFATGLNLHLIHEEEDEGKLINKRAPRLELPRPLI